MEVCVSKNDSPFWRLFDSDDNKYVIFDLTAFIRSSWLTRQANDHPEWQTVGNTFEVNIPADVTYDGRKWGVEPHPRWTTRTILPRYLTRGMVFAHKGARYQTIAMQKDVNGRVDARYVTVRDTSTGIVSSVKLTGQTLTQIVGDHDDTTAYHPVIAVGDAVQYGPFDATVVYIGGAIILAIDGHHFQADPLFIVRREFQMDKPVMLTGQQGDYSAGIIGKVRDIQPNQISVEVRGQTLDVPADQAVPMGDIQYDDAIIPRQTSIFWDGQLWLVEGYLCPDRRFPDPDQHYVILHKHWQIRACVPLSDAVILDSRVVDHIIQLQEKVNSLQRHIDNIEIDSDLRDVALCLQDYMDKRLGVKS